MRKEHKQAIQKTLQDVLTDIKTDKVKIDKIKKEIVKHGIIAGEVSKVLINPEKLEELSVSKTILIYTSTYKHTNDNRLNMNDMPIYNPEIKATFLNNKYNAKTQINVMRIFEKSKESEAILGKDLSEFTLEELESFLSDLQPLTKSSSHVNGRIVSVYIDWCMTNTDLSIDYNDLKNKEMEWFDNFVDKDLQLYITEENLRKLEDDCVNYQDAVIFRLLFEGIQGRKDLAELRNITLDDITWETNEITVYDYDGKERVVTVSDRAMFLMSKAFEINEYVKKNGAMEENDHMGLTTNLVENNYLLRTSITRTDQKDRPVDKMVVYRRIKTVDETNRLGITNLTVKNIVRSGIIYEGSKLINNNSNLTKKDYLSICANSKFNINNWYPVKKYCNKEMIFKLYTHLKNNNNSYSLV